MLLIGNRVEETTYGALLWVSRKSEQSYQFISLVHTYSLLVPSMGTARLSPNALLASRQGKATWNMGPSVAKYKMSPLCAVSHKS